MPGTLTPCQQCRDIPITVTPLGVPKAASPEHPKTFLLGFCRSRKRCWVLPASLQAAANFLTPSGPARQGLYPPPMSLFIKNFIFSFYSEQNDEAQWRGGGGGCLGPSAAAASKRNQDEGLSGGQATPKFSHTAPKYGQADPLLEIQDISQISKGGSAWPPPQDAAHSPRDAMAITRHQGASWHTCRQAINSARYCVISGTWRRARMSSRLLTKPQHGPWGGCI